MRAKRAVAICSVPVVASLLFLAGFEFGKRPRGDSLIRAASPGSAPPLSADQLQQAKDIDDQLFTLQKTDREKYDRRYAWMVLQAQMRLAEWGYGTRFTAELDSNTTRAIREYEFAKQLPESGTVNGTLFVLMQADAEAVNEVDELPNFYFRDPAWPNSVDLDGVLQQGNEEVVSPAHIECHNELKTCLEATDFGPQLLVYIYRVTQWTSDRIVAETANTCGTDELRIERPSKTVVLTEIINRPACKASPDAPTPVYTWQLVDGRPLYLDRQKIRSEAIRRIKRFSRKAELLQSDGVPQ